MSSNPRATRLATPKSSSSQHRKAPSPRPAGEPTGRSMTGDLVAGAAVFAILGGCCAMFFYDLNLLAGGSAAVVSGILGMLFADG